MFFMMDRTHYIIQSGLENGQTLGLRVWEPFLGLTLISFLVSEHGLIDWVETKAMFPNYWTGPKDNGPNKN